MEVDQGPQKEIITRSNSILENDASESSSSTESHLRMMRVSAKREEENLLLLLNPLIASPSPESSNSLERSPQATTSSSSLGSPNMIETDPRQKASPAPELLTFMEIDTPQAICSSLSPELTIENDIQDTHVSPLLIEIGEEETKNQFIEIGEVEEVIDKNDFDNNNLHCITCKRSFNRKDTYRHHQRTVHKKDMALVSTTIQHPLIELPDQDDPNFNCKTCKKTFNHRQSYCYHLKTVHAMTVVPRALRVVSPPYSLPGQQLKKRTHRCDPCQKSFTGVYGFLLHRKKTHDTPIPVLNPHVIPDQDDPNLYCTACEKTFNKRQSYRYHLRTVHDMKLKGSRTILLHPDLVPDIHDPTQYCKSCEKTYSTKVSFHQHLRNIHHMELNRPRGRQSSFNLLSNYLLETAGYSTK